MNLKKTASIAFLALGSVIFAQDNLNIAPFKKNLTDKQVLDSIKTTFIHDNLASCIDSMWMQELASLDLYDELTLDIKTINVDEKVDFELPTELLKERLKKLDEKSPFNIEYNIGLENVIKSFLKNRKKSFERLMGVSQYYFPMFEEALAAKNIPLEIKYLAVVESALNPRAVSKMGATGLWQFMYQTGKQYNLNINTYVDERSDAIKSSQAASQYMTNMYRIFGDWDLVLASYNSGPGNVAKAIRRSGGKQNYWNIRKNLPKETQGYVPAFLATMYIFEYHKEHGIKPNRAIANNFATDTIMIKEAMSFKQISDLLDVSIAELQFLNPSYKREFVPFITGEKHFLRLPIDKVAMFTSNEDKIYTYIKHESSRRERPFESMLASKDSSANGEKSVSKTKYHKVRKGDSLSEISDKYGVTMTQLKRWNNLKTSKAPLGRNLKIITTENIAYNRSSKTDSTKVTDSKEIVASKDSKLDKIYKEEKVVSYKDVVKYHKVKSGDNLSEISDKYSVALSDLKKWNKIKSNTIAIGDKLKIIKNERVVSTIRKEIKSEKPVFETKIETNIAQNPSDYYIVQKEDNLFTIAKKFNVSLEDLKKWNNLDNTNIQLGSKLALAKNDDTPKTEVVTTQLKTIEYIVEAGDNLSEIAKKYNVSQSDLKEWNNLEDTTIQLGTKITVGKKLIAVNDSNAKNIQKESVATAYKNDEVKHYYVRKGDSLFSIAKQYPGVSVSDIKKWNKDVKVESLKPGMKLKING
jgi:membrane-bound lytic murein transglycosylase D